jgi:hypothetical protein
MVDVSSQNNSVSINVSSGGNSASINATPDMAQYYSEKSREWAISNRIVDNTDYSSKYYAEKSKESETNSQNYERSVIEKYNSFVEASDQAETEIQTIRDDSILQINTVASSGISDITNKTSEAVTEINSNKETATNEINNAKNSAVTQLSKEAQEQLKNIESTGFYMRDDKLYFINSKGEEEEFKSGGGSGLNGKITNCITSAPQRIKYTLVNGTLTILAGSIVLVPYGTEDKTAEFPIGSTFIHENFKVYDKQFMGGKFTVWAELQNDITTDTASSLSSRYYFSVNLTTGEGNGSRHSESGTSKTATNTYTVYYNSNTHLVNSSEGTTAVTTDINSFPIITGYSNGTYYYGTIDEVYQYAGQVGGIMWLDKDVEALIPDGKENGVQKNIVFKSQKLYITTQAEANQTDTSGEIGYNYDTDTIGNFGMYYQVSYDGYIYNKKGELRRIVTFGTWDTSTAGGAFTSYKLTQPFIAFDENKKYVAAGWGYPSSKKINYAVGASQSKYTAPANGWVYGGAKFTTNGNNYTIIGRWNGKQRDLLTISRSSYAGSCASLLPVKRGDIFDFEYSSASNTNLNLAFFYAEGEV